MLLLRFLRHRQRLSSVSSRSACGRRRRRRRPGAAAEQRAATARATTIGVGSRCGLDVRAVVSVAVVRSDRGRPHDLVGAGLGVGARACQPNSARSSRERHVHRRVVEQRVRDRRRQQRQQQRQDLAADDRAGGGAVELGADALATSPAATCRRRTRTSSSGWAATGRGCRAGWRRSRECPSARSWLMWSICEDRVLLHDAEQHQDAEHREDVERLT